MKKRLLVIFLFLVPFAYSLECITYDECFEKTCYGASRMCIEGTCVSTECAVAEEASPIDSKVNWIIKFSGKIILMILAVLVVALLFPMLGLHRKAKALAVIGFILVTAFFGYYLFKEEDFAVISGWQSDEPDTVVLDLLHSEEYDVNERLIPKSTFGANGKEYTLGSVLRESTIIALQMTERKEAYDIIEGFKESTFMDHHVFVDEHKLYKRYAWVDGNHLYMLAGESKESDNILNIIFRERNITKQVITPGTPPRISFLTPNTTYTSDKMVSFEITDTDSKIDMTSLRVSTSGFDLTDCRIENRIHKCQFEAELVPGENLIEIVVSDLGKISSTSRRKVNYDVIPWVLEPVYPKNGDYVNAKKVQFRVTDSESGMDFFNIAGIARDSSECKSISDGYECEFDNIDLKSGSNNIIISGSDKAGNEHESAIQFFFDDVRPEIELTTKGFIVSDNLKLRDDSLFLDNRRYSLDDCHLIDKKWHCQYNRFIREVSVMDEAGNKFYIENKLQR